MAKNFSEQRADCLDLCSALKSELEIDLLLVPTQSVINDESFSAKSTVRDLNFPTC